MAGNYSEEEMEEEVVAIFGEEPVLETSFAPQRGPDSSDSIWQYFETITRAGSKVTVCREPRCKYENKGRNNSTCQNHLKSKHKAKYEEFELKRKKKALEKEGKLKTPKGQMEMESFLAGTSGKNCYPRSSFKYQRIAKKLTAFFAGTTVPMFLVTNEEFRDLISELDPRFPLPHSHQTITNWVLKYASDVKSILKDDLKNAQWFSICLDLWTQHGFQHSYLGVTAHFYSFSQKKLLSLVLAVEELPHPHSAPRIREAVDKVLASWGVREDRVLRYVTDSGSNVIAAYVQDIIECTETREGEEVLVPAGVPNLDDSFMELPDEEVTRYFPKRISCFAHRLNNCLESVIDDAHCSLQPLKDDVLQLIRKFSKSGAAIEKLVQLTGKTVVRASNTRWNSFFLVLERLLDCKDGIVAVCKQQKWLISFSWEKVALTKDFLHPFHKFSIMLEGDQQVSASAVLPALLSLLGHLREERFQLFGTTARKLRQEIQKRFLSSLDPRGVKFDPTFLIAAMLDPPRSLNLTNELYQCGKKEVATFFRARCDQEEKEAEGLEGTMEEEALGEREVQESQIQKPQEFPHIQRRTVQANPSTVPEPDKVEEEIKKYLALLDCGKFKESLVGLQFWQENACNFENLHKAALGFLCIPATSAPVERVFSQCGISSSGRRANIGPELLESEVMIRCNKKVLNGITYNFQ